METIPPETTQMSEKRLLNVCIYYTSARRIYLIVCSSTIPLRDDSCQTSFRHLEDVCFTMYVKLPLCRSSQTSNRRTCAICVWCENISDKRLIVRVLCKPWTDKQNSYVNTQIHTIHKQYDYYCTVGLTFLYCTE